MLNFYSSVTGIEPEEYNGKIPQEFYLRQNFPNPFNPITNIRFEVPNSTPVTINIYNAVGQLVTTLINGQSFAPGTYSVTWDASNVSSGVYFYQLKTDSYQQTMKMILLK